MKPAQEIALGDEIYSYSHEKILLKGIISQNRKDDFMLSVDSKEGMSGQGVFNNKNELVGIVLGKDYLEQSAYAARVDNFDNINEAFSYKDSITNASNKNYDTSYCEDEEDLEIWNSLAKSDNFKIQELHALFLGLCEKVKNRDLTTDKAQVIFENSRQRLLK